MYAYRYGSPSLRRVEQSLGDLPGAPDLAGAFRGPARARVALSKHAGGVVPQLRLGAGARATGEGPGTAAGIFLRSKTVDTESIHAAGRSRVGRRERLVRRPLVGYARTRRRREHSAAVWLTWLTWLILY